MGSKSQYTPLSTHSYSDLLISFFWNSCMVMKLLLIVAAVSALAQARRSSSKGPQSTIHGDLVHNPRLEFQKEASNTIHHGPQYASKHKQHDKLARKKSKYYKKLYGHKGEHREANTKYDHDDITLQHLSLTPTSNNHKDVKDFNKMMKMQHLKPNKKKFTRNGWPKRRQLIKRSSKKRKNINKKRKHKFHEIIMFNIQNQICITQLNTYLDIKIY